MLKTLARSGLAAGWIILMAVIALYVVPPPWEGTGGRDFRPQASVLAILLLFSATLLRFRWRWPWGSLAGGLALIEVLILLTIGFFSGLMGPELFSLFNLRWLAYLNIFIGLPWIMGIAIGSGWVWLTENRVRKTGSENKYG